MKRFKITYKITHQLKGNDFVPCTGEVVFTDLACFDDSGVDLLFDINVNGEQFEVLGVSKSVVREELDNDFILLKYKASCQIKDNLFSQKKVDVYIGDYPSTLTYFWVSYKKSDNYYSGTSMYRMKIIGQEID